MEEFYKLIETQIANSGCPIPLKGEEIYDDICDLMDDKEPGTYLLLSKKGDDFFIEYRVDIYEETFNLSTMDIHGTDTVYHIEFDR